MLLRNPFTSEQVNEFCQLSPDVSVWFTPHMRHHRHPLLSRMGPISIPQHEAAHPISSPNSSLWHPINKKSQYHCRSCNYTPWSTNLGHIDFPSILALSHSLFLEDGALEKPALPLHVWAKTSSHDGKACIRWVSYYLLSIFWAILSTKVNSLPSSQASLK